MPYAFRLPTTSTLSYSTFLDCTTHPSLTFTASIQRSVLRDALKRYKRLDVPAQVANLSVIFSAFNEYLPYLFALDSGLSGHQVGFEEVDVILRKEIEVEWRPCLSASLPGREIPRVKGEGLDYELCFALNGLASAYTISARAQLHSLYSSSTPTAEQRTAVITAATKYLLTANSIHSYIVARTGEVIIPQTAIDIQSTTQSALASLSLAEATLLAVLKDDPYPALVAQDRNSNDKEWMFKAPDLPKVRAHLFARLCLAAAEHVGRSHALLSGSAGASGKGVNESIIRYTKDLRRTCRAKACRFFGIDAELGGKMGDAIAWLNGGKKELRFKTEADGGSRTTKFAKFKKGFTERREDKKIENGGEWGNDAGRFEEARVIEMLEKKWNKFNDTVSP